MRATHSLPFGVAKYYSWCYFTWHWDFSTSLIWNLLTTWKYFRMRAENGTNRPSLIFSQCRKKSYALRVTLFKGSSPARIAIALCILVRQEFKKKLAIRESHITMGCIQPRSINSMEITCVSRETEILTIIKLYNWGHNQLKIAIKSCVVSEIRVIATMNVIQTT